MTSNDPSEPEDDLDKKLSEHADYEETTNTLYHESINIVEWDPTPEELAKVANKSYFTVVIYDVADDKRRVKLANLLLGYTVRVQYSGFEGFLSMKQLDTMTLKIKALIDHEMDRVRIYRIAGVPQMIVLGRTPAIEEEEFTVL